LNRVSGLPYQEIQEEIRLTIVKILQVFLDQYPSVFTKEISTV